MTINELINNFRQALLGIIPSVDAVGIPWGQNEAYDEWDSLASNLYGVLVLRPLQWTFSPNDLDSFALPPYDLLLRSYSGLSVIEVSKDNPDSTISIFHSLTTFKEPFDTVLVRPSTRAGMPISDDLLRMSLPSTVFQLRHLRSTEETIVVRHVELDQEASG